MIRSVVFPFKKEQVTFSSFHLQSSEIQARLLGLDNLPNKGNYLNLSFPMIPFLCSLPHSKLLIQTSSLLFQLSTVKQLELQMLLCFSVLQYFQRALICLFLLRFFLNFHLLS